MTIQMVVINLGEVKENSLKNGFQKTHTGHLFKLFSSVFLLQSFTFFFLLSFFTFLFLLSFF